MSTDYCQDPDLNWRHEDFQSTALPLSYSGVPLKTGAYETILMFIRLSGKLVPVILIHVVIRVRSANIERLVGS